MYVFRTIRTVWCVLIRSDFNTAHIRMVQTLYWLYIGILRNKNERSIPISSLGHYICIVSTYTVFLSFETMGRPIPSSTRNIKSVTTVTPVFICTLLTVHTVTD